ncbi:MAG: AI-2E family transporter [Thermodesulfobacteriota bacterium]
MNTSNQPNDKVFMAKALESIMRIGLVLLLIYWCYNIAHPFLPIIFWGIIIAVTIKPIYDRLKSVLGGRGTLAAILITLLPLILLIVPTYLLSDLLISSSKEYLVHLKQGTLSVPPPSEKVASWPVIGKPLYEFWSLASNNLETALMKIPPQFKNFGTHLLSSAAGIGVGILKFVVSMVIAGVLLAKADVGAQAALSLATRLRYERGGDTVKLAAATVRSVALGILGVALIQALLAGVGFVVVDLPAAGLLALLVLIVAVVQIPTIVILCPIIIYVFYTHNTIVAVVFTVWCIIVGLSDNILKPLLMGRGVDVPMIVIFIGAIGGFITYGLPGLFAGAFVFALSYELFLSWLNDDTQIGT